MFVMVDKNEEATNPDVVNNLRRFFPNLECTPLDCGDMKIILDNGDVLAIERKNAGDFLASIGDGRLFDQVERMSNSSKWCAVIIVGNISFDKDDMAVIPVYNKKYKLMSAETTGWKGSSVRAATYTIMWSGCLTISIEPYAYPHAVMEMIRICSKPEEHTQSLARKRIITFPPPTLAEVVVGAFPGVGLTRARALLEFATTQNDTGTGTLAEALSWASVLTHIAKASRPKGWGDATINNVREALGLQPWEELDVKINMDILKQHDPALYKKMTKKGNSNGK